MFTPMDNKQLDERLERIELKLDNFLERTTESRNDIQWLKGSIKLIVTAIVSLVGLVISAFLNLISGN